MTLIRAAGTITLALFSVHTLMIALHAFSIDLPGPLVPYYVGSVLITMLISGAIFMAALVTDLIRGRA